MLKRVPNTFIIVFSIVVLAAIATWIVPSGTFDRTQVVVENNERTIIVPNSFHYTEPNPQTWQVFSALFEGFVDKADIIVFILLIGGSFWIMNESKAIDVGIYSFLRFTKKLEHWSWIRFFGIDNIVLTLIMLMFSVFGATFGMSEETIAFIVVLVPLAITMGYDSITGAAMVFVAAGLGFAGAILNPFTIGIAQGLSNLPMFSGIEYRLFSWLMINLLGISYILWYARRVKKNPSFSPVYEEDAYWREKESHVNETVSYQTPKIAWMAMTLSAVVIGIFAWAYPQSTLKLGNSSLSLPILPVLWLGFLVLSTLSLRKSVHFFILTLLLFTILFLITGVMAYSWYVMEIASLFFAMGIISGVAMAYSADKIVKLFMEGVKDILSAALIVGLAGGIIIVLQHGQVIDTMLYKLSSLMQETGKITSVGTMYTIQTLINLILPSGSAKAALTMPIMAPFSDLIGLSRQATVMAFQFGDGFTNMITPTSGVLIAVLGVARIPFDKWVKWIAPLMLMLIILGFLLLIPTVSMDLNGF